MAQFLNRHLKSGLVPDWIIRKLAKAPEKQKASIEIFTEIVSGLKDLCQGIHIITDAIAEVMADDADAIEPGDQGIAVAGG